MISPAITDRVVGKLGISIGTELALESVFNLVAFDSGREIPNKVKPEDYKQHIFNIPTLFRNVLGSIKDKDKELLTANSAVHDQLINDIHLIMELYSQVDTKLVFYLPNYTSVYKLFNKGKPSSLYPPYVAYTFMLQYLKKLQYPTAILSGNKMAMLPATPGKTLLLSSYTMDLMSLSRIPKLELLESHTGKIKTNLDMWSKYHKLGKQDMSILPVHKNVLYIFGDKTIVKPLPINDRKAFLEIAHVTNWTPIITASKIKKDSKDFNNNLPG